DDRGVELVVDSSDDRIYVLANRDAGPDWSEPMLLRFESPASVPTLEIDLRPDSDPDTDSGRALALTSTGELVVAFGLDESEHYDFSVAGLDKTTGAITWERPSTDYGLGLGEARVFVGDLAARADGGLAVVGWGQGINVSHQEAFLLKLDASLELSCLGFLDSDHDEHLEGGPLLAGLVVGDAGQVYASGTTVNLNRRTLVTAWESLALCCRAGSATDACERRPTALQSPRWSASRAERSPDKC